VSGFLILALLPAVSANTDAAAQRLIRCIESRNASCLASELKSPPGQRSPEYLSAAAEAYLLLGRKQQAMGAIEAAVSRKPGDYELLMQQGRTYQRCGAQVQAIEAFLHAAKITQSTTVFYNIGLSFFLVHEYARARRHFTHSVQLDSKNDKAEFMLGVLDVLENHDDMGAKKHLERALEIAPQNPHYLLHYGIVLSEIDDPGAIPVLEKAVRSDPSNPLAHFNLGRRYRRVGELRKARTELEEAVRMRPQMARAQYQLAAVYRELGELDKAAQATEQFLKFRDQDRDDDPVDGPPSYAFHDQPVK
jgi:tetratricopeptide (TPR) repeat protein